MKQGCILDVNVEDYGRGTRQLENKSGCTYGYKVGVQTRVYIRFQVPHTLNMWMLLAWNTYLE